jgi:hypothetical protein
MWRQKGKCITRDVFLYEEEKGLDHVIHPQVMFLGFLYEEEKGLDHVIHPQVTFLECTCSNEQDGTNESSISAKDQGPSFVATDKEQWN